MGLSLCDKRVAWQMLERVSASDLGNLGCNALLSHGYPSARPSAPATGGVLAPSSLPEGSPCQPLPAWEGGYPDNLQPWGQSP